VAVPKAAKTTDDNRATDIQLWQEACCQPGALQTPTCRMDYLMKPSVEHQHRKHYFRSILLSAWYFLAGASGQFASRDYCHDQQWDYKSKICSGESEEDSSRPTVQCATPASREYINNEASRMQILQGGVDIPIQGPVWFGYILLQPNQIANMKTSHASTPLQSPKLHYLLKGQTETWGKWKGKTLSRVQHTCTVRTTSSSDLGINQKQRQWKVSALISWPQKLLIRKCNKT